MKIRSFAFSLFLACALTLASSQPAFAKKMYKWVNEKGETFFSDQVPPEHNQYRRESLNEKGEVVEVTEQEKNKEQQAIDNRIKALKQAQEKIIAQQEANDRVLLSTFRSLKDLEASLYATMQSLDAQRNVAQGNLKRAEQLLQTQQKKAAELERDGKPVPKKLLDEIKYAETQVQAAYAEINKQIEKKNRAKAEYETNIERFKFLTREDKDTSSPQSEKATKDKIADEIGLYNCETNEICEKAWASVHDFIRANATTPIDTDTDKLIMGRAPATDSDLALSVSKMEDENKKLQLFLDIRCRESSLGRELCDSQKVRDIRSSFRTYIESAVGIGN